MSISVTKGYTFGATEQVTNTKLHTLVDSATVAGIAETDITFDGSTAMIDTGTQTMAGNKTFSGDTTFTGTITGSGNVTHSGDVTVTGTLTADGGTIESLSWDDILSWESEVVCYESNVISWET